MTARWSCSMRLGKDCWHRWRTVLPRIQRIARRSGGWASVVTRCGVRSATSTRRRRTRRAACVSWGALRMAARSSPRGRGRDRERTSARRRSRRSRPGTRSGRRGRAASRAADPRAAGRSGPPRHGSARGCPRSLAGGAARRRPGRRAYRGDASARRAARWRSGPGDRCTGCRSARCTAADRPGSGTAGSRARCAPSASSWPWRSSLDTPAASSPHHSADAARSEASEPCVLTEPGIGSAKRRLPACRPESRPP